MDKKAIRRRIIRQRDRLSQEEIAGKSRSIAEQLYALPVYRNARKVMFFITFGSEVDTRPMVEEAIKKGKMAFAPKAVAENRELIPSRILDRESDLAPGAYNIPEPTETTLRPIEPEAIDLVIVPGVAFDLKGNRLGYGGGYYDRFFKRLDPLTPLVAPAFELQLLQEVPVDKWDRRVDIIITEKRVISTNRKKKTT